jgi:hypothetical protein
MHAVGEGVTGPIVNKYRIVVDIKTHRSPQFLISRGTEDRRCLLMANKGPVEVCRLARSRASITERHKWKNDQYWKGVNQRECMCTSSVDSESAGMCH